MSHFSVPTYEYCPNCGAKTRSKLMDGQTVKVCAADCGFAHFNNPTPVVAVIVETPEGVVLAHNVGWPGGIFSIITGYVDPYELPEQTAIRETKEELGIKNIVSYPYARSHDNIKVETTSGTVDGWRAQYTIPNKDLEEYFNTEE